jgi:hypothetical protein
MLWRILTPTLLTVGSAHPAVAAYYVYWNDGSFTYVPDQVVILALLLGLLLYAGWVFARIDRTSSSSLTRLSDYLPQEIREPDTAEHYDEMTERTRALKRKLDADTELAESYFRAARVKAELEDLDYVPDENPTSWRLRGPKNWE